MAFVFTKKYVIALSIAAGLLVTGAGTYLAVLPTVEKITTTQTDIVSAEAEVLDMQGRLDGLKISQGQYENIKTLDTQLEEQFPSSLDKSLLFEINSAASQSGTALSNVEFTPPTIVLAEVAADPNAAAGATDPNAAAGATDPNAATGATDPNAATGATAPTTGFGDGFAKSTFSLSVKGTENSVQQFLDILNKNGRAIVVTQASFTTEGADTTLSLTGQAYLTKPVASPEELIAQQAEQAAEGTTDGGEVVVEDGSTTN